MAKKEKTGLEFIESAEALQHEIVKAESFFTKNKNLLTYAGGAIIAVVLGYFGYKYYTTTQNQEAQAAMYDSVFYFENDSLNLALNGAGGNAGLLEIADDYSSTKAGKLANLYVGIIYMKQGKYDEAIERLENFNANDEVVQGRAYCLIGDAHAEKNELDDAISYYKKAVDFKPNKFITPGYLMKLAGAYEEAKNTESAIEAYGELITDYPTATEATLAKKYKSRLEAESGQ